MTFLEKYRIINYNMSVREASVLASYNPAVVLRLADDAYYSRGIVAYCAQCVWIFV